MGRVKFWIDANWVRLSLTTKLLQTCCQWVSIMGWCVFS